MNAESLTLMRTFLLENGVKYNDSIIKKLTTMVAINPFA